jgi:valyl-tRNA synthetase
VTASPKRAADTRAEDLPKAWDPGTAESATYQRWVDAGYFTADPAGTKRGYSIVLPPPNVTGSLRMGHALEHTMMDALTRRKRMQGYEVLWQPGMDHAGIATTAVLAAALDTLLRLLHPVISFVTETLWKSLPAGSPS